MSEASESAAVLRLRRGDPSALDVIFRTHAHSVYRAAISFLADQSFAEDVVQDTFFTLWKRRAQVNIVGESILPWLLVTTRNISYSTNRREQRRRHQPISDDIMPVGNDDAATDRLLDARRLVGHLSEKDQLIWEACIERDLSYEDAARSLDLSQGVVRNRLSRMRALLTTAEKDGTS